MFGCMYDLLQEIRHKLSGLKQHRFIVLEFWKSEVRSGSHWAQTRVSVGLSSFIEAMGDNHSLAFPASGGCSVFHLGQLVQLEE